MENHLYGCLYDILRGEMPETDKYYTLQRYKAKIVNLHSKKRAKILLDTHAHDKMKEEDLTLYHVVQQRRRRELQEIREIQDTDVTTYTRPTDIRNTFVRHLAQKFGPITVDDNAITALLHNMPQVNPSTYAAQLESLQTRYTTP
jgi:glutamate 5-kinase